VRAMLELKQLSKRMNGRPVLAGIDLEIAAGRPTAIAGLGGAEREEDPIRNRAGIRVDDDRIRARCLGTDGGKRHVGIRPGEHVLLDVAQRHSARAFEVVTEIPSRQRNFRPWSHRVAFSFILNHKMNQGERGIGCAFRRSRRFGSAVGNGAEQRRRFQFRWLFIFLLGGACSTSL